MSFGQYIDLRSSKILSHLFHLPVRQPQISLPSMYPSASTAVVDDAFILQNRQLMSQVQSGNYAPNMINPAQSAPTMLRPVAKTFPVARDPYAGAPFMHTMGVSQPNPAGQQQAARPPGLPVNQAALMQAMLQQQQQQMLNSGNAQASYLQNNNVAVAAAAAAAVAATQQVRVQAN